MDIRLNYIEKGEGFPLILLHGNGESLEYFENQICFFSRYFRVIAVDTRGHGKSPRGTAPFTISQFALDLADFLDEMKIEKAHILGFSDGGNIALLFALSHHERVEKLILNGANLYPSGVKLKYQLPIVLEWAILSVLAPFSESADKKKELLSLMVREPHIKPIQLSALEIPVLVAVGNHDMIKHSHSELIAGALPRSELCIIDGTHFIAAENSAEFNYKVISFLKTEK